MKKKANERQITFSQNTKLKKKSFNKFFILLLCNIVEAFNDTGFYDVIVVVTQTLCSAPRGNFVVAA